MAVKMKKPTIRERILLHLNRFSMIDEEEMYNLPFDLTQDGIGGALGISRAHSSLELKKLRQRRKIKEKQVRVLGSNVKRKVYYLEPEGKIEAEFVEKRLEAAGISVETVLDMRRCDPELMWEKLKESDRDALGLACVIRVPVYRDMLPPTDSGVIPATHEGLVNISEDVKKKYLDAIDPEFVRKWNSDAADWWVDNVPDDQERLYHLVKAGRSMEANRLLVRASGDFIANCNDDLLEIIKNMDDPDKTPLSVWSIRGKIAVSCQDSDYARICAGKLRELDSNEGDMLEAEIKYVEGNFEGALSDANKIYSETKSARVAMLTGRSLFALERYDAAEEALIGTMKEFSSSGDISRLDEMLILRAGIAYNRKDKDACISLLHKALYTARSEERKNRISEIVKSIKSGKIEPMFD